MGFQILRMCLHKWILWFNPGSTLKEKIIFPNLNLFVEIPFFFFPNWAPLTLSFTLVCGSVLFFLFHFFLAVCTKSSKNTEGYFCFKNAFWYTRGLGGQRLWWFKSGERFKIRGGAGGKLLKRLLLAIGLDMCSLTHSSYRFPSHASSLAVYNSALCSDPCSRPPVCYSCMWYCTLEQAQTASMVTKRKHKE